MQSIFPPCMKYFKKDKGSAVNFFHHKDWKGVCCDNYTSKFPVDDKNPEIRCVIFVVKIVVASFHIFYCHVMTLEHLLF